MSGSAGPLLAIDSSTSTGSVAVGAAGHVLAEVSLRVAGGHSSALMPAVDYAIRSAGLKPADLGGVVVGAGPGSFTGLRIAGATAKGIVQGLEVPLFAYSSLLAAAAQAWSAAGPVCALFDARGRDVFAACYRFGDGIEAVLPPRALSVDELIQRMRSSGGDVLFLGDGAERHAKELTTAGVGRCAPSHFGVPRAAALIWLAETWPERGRVADPAAWQPDYLRASGAERIAAARRAETDAAVPRADTAAAAPPTETDVAGRQANTDETATEGDGKAARKQGAADGPEAGRGAS
ncbi:MAG: tRNA (adenosine(37)-N6)-threonylcarbamoyltransferase complex dimerization subunit type 1 TsaB [Gemmatimonadota bacterium]